MAIVVEGETLAATNALPWWRQRWGVILGGFALCVLVGIISAQITRSSGHWDTGLDWERALLIRMHTPLPRGVDQLMLVFPWFVSNAWIMVLVGAALMAIPRFVRI